MSGIPCITYRKCIKDQHNIVYLNHFNKAIGKIYTSTLTTIGMAKLNHTKRDRRNNVSFQSEIALTEKRQIMKERYNRECYKCKVLYFKIKGFKHFDNGYCSERCYVFRNV